MHVRLLQQIAALPKHVPRPAGSQLHSVQLVGKNPLGPPEAVDSRGLAVPPVNLLRSSWLSVSVAPLLSKSRTLGR